MTHTIPLAEAERLVRRTAGVHVNVTIECMQCKAQDDFDDTTLDRIDYRGPLEPCHACGHNDWREIETAVDGRTVITPGMQADIDGQTPYPEVR